MARRPRRVVAFIGAAVLAAGSAAGVAACGSDADQATAGTAAPSTSTAGQSTGTQPGAPDMSGLAQALGVSEAKLQAALSASRPSGGQAGAPGNMAATLAKALGLSEAKVQAALEANRPSGAPPAGGEGQAPPSGAEGQAPAMTAS